ncbi:MAG: OmpA family protein, partial [Spirochaetales bacterium]|nr:OmpA family protein [Spirochaetales bacterium]
MGTHERDNKTKQTQIYFPSKGEFNIASFTDRILEIGQKGAVPVIDAHMHIQSNNIAPCTIQWGAIRGLLATALANNPELLQKEMEQAELYSGIAKWGAIPLWIVGNILVPMPATVRGGTFGAAVLIAVLADAINSTVKYLEQKDIDDLGNLLLRKADKELLNTVQACISPLFMKDFGKLGVLDTDVVGKVFMGYDGELDVQNYAVNYQTYEHIKEIYGLDSKKFPFENSVINKAAEYFLEEMSEEEAMKLMTQRQDMMENFSNFTKYYYCNRDKTHLYYTMPMDLGYSHYWGYYSLPIYLPKNSNDLYYISEVPYYLGLMDNLRYFISFIEKEKNKHDKISPVTVKELAAKRVQKKIIDFSVKRIESLQSNPDTNHTRLTNLESHFKNNADITEKINELKNVIAEVKAGLNKLLYGNPETREKGIIERLNTDVIGYIISIINAYINKTNEQAEEYDTYSSIPEQYRGSVKPEMEKIERESEELYKIYHTLSCYAGKRIEDLEDFFKDQLNTLKALLKRKFFTSLDECVINLIYIRGEEQKGYSLPEGHMYKRQLNEAYDLIMKNRDAIKEDIQLMGNRLKKEISTIKEQIDVYNAGYNKIIWHGIKPGDYTSYFRFGSVLCKGTEKSEGSDEVKLVDIIPDDHIETINFGSDVFQLSGENIRKLETLIDELLKKSMSKFLLYGSTIKIKIAGYTSFTESKKNDARYLADLQRLSENRAEYTKNKLLELLGSNKYIFEIITEGHSHNDPVASNATESGKAQNQRAEIYL